MNFNLSIFLSVFLISVSVSLILFAVLPDAGLLFLAKLLAFSIAITLLSPFWYPHVRGLKPGDRVIIDSLSPMVRPRARLGTVSTPGRLGDIITVIGDDGEEYKCKIISYPGTFSKARVRVHDNYRVVQVQ